MTNQPFFLIMHFFFKLITKLTMDLPQRNEILSFANRLFFKFLGGLPLSAKDI